MTELTAFRGPRDGPGAATRGNEGPNDTATGSGEAQNEGGRGKDRDIGSAVIARHSKGISSRVYEGAAR